jgi:hypothetical protein
LMSCLATNSRKTESQEPPINGLGGRALREIVQEATCRQRMIPTKIGMRRARITRTPRRATFRMR